MALMEDPQGNEHRIVAAGVDALVALGWTVTEPDKAGDEKDDKPTPKRATRSRSKSE